MAKSTQQDLSNHEIHVVEPGFNQVGVKSSEQQLTAPASMQVFDKKTQEILKGKKTFTLVLGKGFEEPPTTAAMAIGMGACAGLQSMEQLRFLKENGLQRIVMARLHGTLVQNARALGIEVIVGGL